MSNKRKLDRIEFSIKESLRKRVRSRPNKTSNEGFDHDDPELHTPPVFPPRPKKDLKELKDCRKGANLLKGKTSPLTLGLLMRIPTDSFLLPRRGNLSSTLLILPLPSVRKPKLLGMMMGQGTSLTPFLKTCSSSN